MLQTIAFVMCIGVECIPFHLSFTRTGYNLDVAPIVYPAWCDEMASIYIENGLSPRVGTPYHKGQVNGYWLLKGDFSYAGLSFTYLPESVRCWPDNAGPV